MADDKKKQNKSGLVNGGVTLHDLIGDALVKYIKARGIEPKYLIISPDHADKLSQEIYISSKHYEPRSWQINGGEKYNGLTILILPGKLQFIEVAG